MNLTARLSAFSLIGVFVILCGFSVTLFTLADHHLTRQIDSRIDSGMHAVVAAIEVHPNDVEWEPLERRITLGDDAGDDQIRWAVHDASGRLVDCSRNLTTTQLDRFDLNGDWRILVRRVSAGGFQPEKLTDHAEPSTGRLGDRLGDDSSIAMSSLPDDRTCQSTAFTLTVAIPWTPVATSLHQLAWALAGISGSIMVATAVLGRWVCRRALRPVTRMAHSARLLPVGDPTRRLEVASTNDEVEDLGQAFNELLLRLHSTYDQQRRFTGDAAHQLRTPLTTLLGQIEVALRQPRSDEEYRRVLGILQRRTIQLSQIVESLLFLSRSDADVPLPNLEIVDLNAWLRAYAHNWSGPRLDNIQFANEVEQPCLVRGDESLLTQLLDGLLDNACKYSDPSTPIRIEFQVRPDAFEIVVEDRGCGISADDLPHVCEPFFRAAATRLRGAPGIGLGLAVSGRIAKALGGNLEIVSELGRGTRVKVIVPSQKICVDPARSANGRTPVISAMRK
jgi:signal transduction histidine kinase